jgi:hypothetical protein
MGEKGNIADVRSTGGHVASPTQAAPRPQDVGLGGQSVSGAAPAPPPLPPPPPAQGGGGGLLSDLADKATDKATDAGLGIVKGRKDNDDNDTT